MTTSNSPLDVIIIGAGISGLSTAIALRRIGHNVKIYERSNLKNELGAAIHISPNASRILLSWDFDVKRARFVKAMKTYIASGNTLQKFYEGSYDHVEPTYGAAWYLSHRVDLHEELKRLATTSEGPGKPAVIIPNSKVDDYDVEAGTITLSNSEVHKADLIVAADGVHSQATKHILGSLQYPEHTGQSAFRFLIPTADIIADPETADFVKDDDGRFKVFTGVRGNRIVWYPCRNNEEQNFAAIFHEDTSETKEDWDASVSGEKLLEEYQDFHPAILAVFRKAKSVKKWPLLFREPLPAWYKSKLVLVGDAAHPMLPHQGQAGAQAIEDSVALGVVLNGVTKTELQNDPNALAKRLELYQTIRRRRAAAMQIFSNFGQDQGDKCAEAVKPYHDGPIPMNPAEFIVYNFSYNVKDHSEQALKDAKL
ncbi:putative salicylate hydroxylase [Microthyrium microscopicum]|uniref:Putative salicylate hydroxylase n=1 Tax=Microthyrium microscopicum TaxID=703497 RepID=A0A6A6TXY4_9PEZI|nr:putative salicylate hydroxylase [Microthyrium microscopicum]